MSFVSVVLLCFVYIWNADSSLCTKPAPKRRTIEGNDAFKRFLFNLIFVSLASGSCPNMSDKMQFMLRRTLQHYG